MQHIVVEIRQGDVTTVTCTRRLSLNCHLLGISTKLGDWMIQMLVKARKEDIVRHLCNAISTQGRRYDLKSRWSSFMLDAEHKHKVSSTLNASKKLKILSLLVWPMMQEAERREWHCAHLWHNIIAKQSCHGKGSSLHCCSWREWWMFLQIHAFLSQQKLGTMERSMWRSDRVIGWTCAWSLGHRYQIQHVTEAKSRLTEA